MPLDAYNERPFSVILLNWCVEVSSFIRLDRYRETLYLLCLSSFLISNRKMFVMYIDFSCSCSSMNSYFQTDIYTVKKLNEYCSSHIEYPNSVVWYAFPIPMR